MPLHRSLKAMLKLCLSLLVLQTLTTRIGTAIAADWQRPIAKPGCPENCGGFSVPYPFGLKEGCYLKSSTNFFLNCSRNETLFFSPNSASYGSHQFPVAEISTDGYLHVRTPILTACNDESIDKPIITSPEFPFSSGNNFVVVGCDTFGIIAKSGYSSGCSTFCTHDTDFNKQVSTCTGTGCCQTPYITDESAMGSMWNYTIQLRRVTNHTEMGGKEYPCSSAFLAYSYSMPKESELNTIGNRDDITAIINWAVGNESCSEAKSKVSYACKAKHSRCEDAQNPTGYRCICKYEDDYYDYNSYLEDGCPGRWDFILHQSLGAAERKNCTIIEMARSMLNVKGVPKLFWVEDVATTVYILNISPTKAVYNQTPYEAWKGNLPKVNQVRTLRRCRSMLQA